MVIRHAVIPPSTRHLSIQPPRALKSPSILNLRELERQTHASGYDRDEDGDLLSVVMRVGFAPSPDEAAQHIAERRSELRWTTTIDFVPLHGIAKAIFYGIPEVVEIDQGRIPRN